MSKALTCVILMPIISVLSWSSGLRLVDMSYVYDRSTLGWYSDKPFLLNVTQRGMTDKGAWLQTEEIFCPTHWGTHIDAPCHLAKRRWSLEEIPLTRLVKPAAVVDISDRAATDPDAKLLISDLENWEYTWGQTLDETIVLVRTGWGSRWPHREAYTGTSDIDATQLRFPGVSVEAAQWLVHNRRICGLGIDTLSIDSGINVLSEVTAHRILLEANIYSLDNVANLDKLPGYGARLHVSPMRLGGKACASPTRIVAVLP